MASLPNTLPEAFQNASNAIPVRQPIPTLSTTTNNDVEEKQKSDWLEKAITAPLTPAGMEAPTMSESSSHEATEAGMTQALPLSAQQIARLSQALENTDNDTLHTTLKKPASRFEVLAGTPISAMTESTIISDLPGTVTARVTQNVYDSVTGHYLLIPQGTKIILQYDNHVNVGQNRVFVTAKRLLFPNGTSMDLDGMPSNDTDGSSGFRDKTDNHYGRTWAPPRSWACYQRVFN